MLSMKQWSFWCDLVTKTPGWFAFSTAKLALFHRPPLRIYLVADKIWGEPGKNKKDVVNLLISFIGNLTYGNQWLKSS